MLTVNEDNYCQQRKGRSGQTSEHTSLAYLTPSEVIRPLVLRSDPDPVKKKTRRRSSSKSGPKSLQKPILPKNKF